MKSNHVGILKIIKEASPQTHSPARKINWASFTNENSAHKHIYQGPLQISSPSPIENLGMSGDMKMLIRQFEICDKIHLGTKPNKSQLKNYDRFDPTKGT